MTWINHILLGFLTAGQVDPSVVADGQVLSSQPKQGGPVSQELPAFPVLIQTTEVGVTPEEAGFAHVTPYEAHRGARNLPEIWGSAGSKIYFGGTRIAPNGLPYHPLGSLDLDLNIGLLPEKKLYVFVTCDFWLQRATAGQSHGSWDFTKRELDGELGVAWNYWGPLELRGVFGYALNNLNRGTSTTIPSGYNDGVGLENRYYFPTNDIYDIPRQSFVSVGYMPAKSITGGDGDTFTPGLFARGYLTYDLNFCNSYVYADGTALCQSNLSLRYLTLDAGVAVRPFSAFNGLEFRLGATDTFDVQPSVNRLLGYVGFRFIF